MLLEQFKNLLESRYEVLNFVDLYDVANNPVLALDAISATQSKVFSSNQRIVFYANGRIGQNTKDFIAYLAEVYDVSRCFILFCGSSFVGSNSGFEFLQFEINSQEFLDHRIIDINSLCVLPWFHMEIMNAGQAKICCFNTQTLTQLTEQSIENLLYSKEYTETRQSMLQGEKPESCKACWQREQLGQESLRQWRNKTHIAEFLQKYFSNPQLKSLSVRPSTICNFKCRICNEGNSSLWAQENLDQETNLQKRKDLMIKIEKSKWFDKDPDKQDNLIAVWPKLEYIDIYGGEPLLIKQFKKLLQTSIDTGVSTMQRLHFNTNGSIYPHDLMTLMENFKEVTISLSIDNIGERFEIERGGDWSTIEHNIDQFLQCNPKIFKISALVTVSNLNVLYLDELLEWSDRKGLVVTFNMLVSPEYLRYDKISQEVKTLIIEKYQNHKDQRLTALANSVKNLEPCDTTKWITEMQRLDQIRNQNFAISHGLLSKAMGYLEKS